MRETTQTILGAFAQVATCSRCRGRGKVYSKDCHTCKGEGRVRKTEKLTVDIPAGIEDGQALSLAGKGEAGKAGSRPGDLYVVVHVRPKSGFERRADSIFFRSFSELPDACFGRDGFDRNGGWAGLYQNPCGYGTGRNLPYQG